MGSRLSYKRYENSVVNDVISDWSEESGGKKKDGEEIKTGEKKERKDEKNERKLIRTRCTSCYRVYTDRRKGCPYCK